MTNSQKAAAAELTRLIGCRSYQKISHRCTGKWRGTTDYGLLFNNGCYLYLSNGMAGFEQSTLEYAAEIVTVRQNREKYIRMLTNRIVIDNDTAIREGLHPVRLIDVNINTENKHLFLWAYLLVEVNGQPIKHIETSLKYNLATDRLEEWLEKRPANIYTAGAVQNPDYIIGNVRYCSSDDLYKINNE